MQLLDVDEIQATAILDMQLRRLAAAERQKIIGKPPNSSGSSRTTSTSWVTPRQRSIVGEELAEIVRVHGDERRSQFMPPTTWAARRTSSPVRDVVVSITEGGYSSARTPGCTARSAAVAVVCAEPPCNATMW